MRIHQLSELPTSSIEHDNTIPEMSDEDSEEEPATVERQSPFHDSSKPSKNDDGYYDYGEDVVTSAKLV